ncbi:hypothetical protein [Gordoniibacillus kamchatkensis]|uniref:hypothetical protein n=1 Tax=Gordoniibacillus kamchatkensis TaxID=1590651 RepID=UPI000698EB2A|nr:hypothetical protein [Paenibacillus sp. VKM B-2647]
MPILKVFLQEILFRQDLRDRFKEQLSEIMLARSRGIVEHFRKQGKVVQYPVADIIRFASTVVIGYVLFRYLVAPELEWDDERDVDITVDLIMHGLTPREFT